MVSRTYTVPSVLLAAGLTAGIFLVLTFYAMFTKTDFTGMGPYLLVALVGLIFFGLASWILGMFFPGIVSITQVIYAALELCSSASSSCTTPRKSWAGAMSNAPI